MYLIVDVNSENIVSNECHLEDYITPDHLYRYFLLDRELSTKVSEMSQNIFAFFH